MMNAEDLAALEADLDTDVTVVQLDGLVVLKIIKHCKEGLPALVTGQILGLDIGSKLEVTNCFPFPNSSNDENEEEVDADGAKYQMGMMHCLREVNVDNNTVGWYQSTYLSSFLTESMIETQFNYQENIKKCVVIIYDPLSTSQGTLSLRAFRLTEPFMNLYKTSSFTQESLTKSGLSFNDIFEELPIKIHNSHLVNGLLMELEENNVAPCDFDRLDLSTNPFLEKNLEFLIECIDDLSTEQNKYQYYQKNLQKQANQKKKQEEDDDTQAPNVKQVQAPSRLESLLITNQINNYCKIINQFTSNSFSKLFLVSGIQEEN